MISVIVNNLTIVFAELYSYLTMCCRYDLQLQLIISKAGNEGYMSDTVKNIQCGNTVSNLCDKVQVHALLKENTISCFNSIRYNTYILC